jgi:hypothetical protein
MTAQQDPLLDIILWGVWSTTCDPQQRDCSDPAVAWSAPLEHSTTTPSITTSEKAIASSPSVMNSSAVAATGGNRLSNPNARNPAAYIAHCQPTTTPSTTTIEAKYFGCKEFHRQACTLLSSAAQMGPPAPQGYSWSIAAGRANRCCGLGCDTDASKCKLQARISAQLTPHMPQNGQLPRVLCHAADLRGHRGPNRDASSFPVWERCL